MTLLGIAVRSLPLGTACAVWTGIGTVGTALLGMVFIALIVVGIFGLELMQ